jgi:hypothetical protein
MLWGTLGMVTREHPEYVETTPHSSLQISGCVWSLCFHGKMYEKQRKEPRFKPGAGDLCL